MDPSALWVAGRRHATLPTGRLAVAEHRLRVVSTDDSSGGEMVAKHHRVQSTASCQGGCRLRAIAAL
jgi:hypothetical protein